tara:strand:- start:870 stop:2828 length:1959 start_codon:yes stop_codon:yes gene_type:complete
MRETSAGADPDRMVPTTVVSGQATVFGAVADGGAASYPAGSSKIYVAHKRNFAPGDFVVIGPYTNANLGFVPAAAATLHSGHTEIRRIEHVEPQNQTNSNRAWFHLDRPLAFNHNLNDGASTPTAINKLSQRYSVPTNSAHTAYHHAADRKHISFVPGVYDTIDTPDPEMALEPRYFLGNSSMRNFTSLYSGQHTYAGALNGIILLNGWPLRWGLGTEIPIPRGVTGTITAAAAITAGDVWAKLTISGTDNTAVGDPLIFNYAATHTLLTADPTVAASPPEVNVIKQKVSGNTWVEFEHPFKYNHAINAVIKEIVVGDGVTHYIIEQNDLDSMCWNLSMKDSLENTSQRFDRRWVGGKVGAMSILAEEGGLLTVNWDSIVFKDMFHNQAAHTTSTSRYPNQTAVTVDDGLVAAGQMMPGFTLMNQYDEADLKLPITEPYYFSGGSVKLIDGTEFARVRGFNISINNNEDPRYYIGQRYGNHKGPSEIREQRREYSMTCTLALPDTGTNNTAGIDKATSLFKELLLEGRYAANTSGAVSTTGGHKGFAISLKFVRGQFTDASNTLQEDAIWIDIPGLDRTSTADFAGAEGSPNSGDITPGSMSKTLSGTVNSSGAFIRSAPHTISTEAPLQVAVDMVFRNMTIAIRDQEPYYP